ncbi:hypothetical protein WAF17_10515 [Bernardetia sp. ABR2-2B]|uniref:hypothetical protein n=1 Tax=Bernardetia sp. ABR2-2B TaxID=3127472 RepID=UPI0030D002DE
MKIFIYLSICISSFFFPKTVFSQNNDLECQQGIDSAKVHIEKGNYTYLVFGLNSSNSYTFGRLLYKDYGINVAYMGCIVYQEPECYSNYMKEKIKEKFGSTIIEKTWQKAKYMDSVGLGDRNSVFEEGNEKMNEFIYSNLKWYKLDFYESKYQNKEDKKYRAFAQIHIDTLGNVKVDSIVRIHSLEFRQEVKRVIEILPKWTTATKNGKIIEQKFSLALSFSEEIRKKYNKE